MDGVEARAKKDQWLAFWATMSGWILDAFDYNILAIILLDIQKSFTVDSVLAGALATFECSTEMHVPGGDHVIFFGRVRRAAFAEGAPLIFSAGTYGTHAPLG